MNAIDSRQQFKNEFIAGVSLINPKVLTNTENNEIQTKIKNRQNQPLLTPIVQTIENKPLEIVGSEFASKSSSFSSTDNQSISKITNSPNDSKARIDSAMFHLPRRTPLITNRKAPEKVLSRTLTSHVPFSSNHSTSDKSSTISSNLHSNTTRQSSDDKLTMTQRSPTNLKLNSSMTILKKFPTPQNQMSTRFFKKPQHSFVNLGREATSIQLPALVKRTPSSIIKPIPSAYIQDSSQLQISSSNYTTRPVLQPTPVLPIYAPNRSVTLYTDQQHLPLIKERIIKANLLQKATFKCKSPLPYRPDSSISRPTTAVITAAQLPTKIHNPLKHIDVGFLLNEAARNRLKRLFNQLDTDRDGHLTYPQVQKCLPSNLPRAQETYFRVLYDITSDTTFFGLQEFYATAVLIDMIAKQDPELWNLLLDDVDFSYYHDDILGLIEQFDSHSSPVASTINFDTLIGLILHRIPSANYDHVAKELERRIPMIKTMKFSRLDFIGVIPLIIYIGSWIDHTKPLFRFRENSVLDLHMKKALVA